jgi:ubiquinone/menaquinone biosynthesis C-methylase UbiE
MPARDLDTQFRRWYDAAAGHYDDRFQGVFATLQAQLIVDLIAPRPGMRILDVGTGTGRGALALAAASDAVIVGLDLTPGMLRRAAENRAAAGLEWPALVQGNGRQLPFPDATFDAVLSIRTLHLFPTPYLGAFVDEMKRVLKPDGVLLVEFNSPLAGCGWVLVRESLRHLRGQKDRHYLWPQHITALFGDMSDCRVYGFWVPGLGKLARAHPRLRGVLRFARLNPPFSYAADKLLVRAVKR